MQKSAFVNYSVDNILDECDITSTCTASAEVSARSQLDTPTQTELEYIEGILTVVQMEYSDRPNFLNLDAKDVYQYLS